MSVDNVYHDKITFIRDMLTRVIGETADDLSMALARQVLIAVRDDLDDRIYRESTARRALTKAEEGAEAARRG